MKNGERVTAGGITVYGISTRTSLQQELDPKSGKIGKLWQRLTAKCLDVADGAYCYGVYLEYVSDHLGPYTVLVGLDKKVAGFSDKEVEIATGPFLRFSQSGPMPGVVFALWQEIWDYFEQNKTIERSFVADYEKYPTQDTVEIYIGIKEEL